VLLALQEFPGTTSEIVPSTDDETSVATCNRDRGSERATVRLQRLLVGVSLHFVHYYLSACNYIQTARNLRKEWDEARIKSPFATGTVLRQQFTKGHVPERVIMKLGGWKTIAMLRRLQHRFDRQVGQHFGSLEENDECLMNIAGREVEALNKSFIFNGPR